MQENIFLIHTKRMFDGNWNCENIDKTFELKKKLFSGVLVIRFLFCLLQQCSKKSIDSTSTSAQTLSAEENSQYCWSDELKERKSISIRSGHHLWSDMDINNLLMRNFKLTHWKERNVWERIIGFLISIVRNISVCLHFFRQKIFVLWVAWSISSYVERNFKFALIYCQCGIHLASS